MALPTRVNRGITNDPFEALQHELDATLGGMFTGRNVNGHQLAPYGVDVREDAEHFYVEAELPGFKKADVEITLENRTLSISAQRNDTNAEPRAGEWLLNERRYTRFLRSFTLPPTVDQQSVNAKLSDGVLTITLSKREEAKPRKIAVV